MAQQSDSSKLRWRCRRGTKELDTLTERYLDLYYSTANKQEQSAFSTLLELQDPELHMILTRKVASQDTDIISILEKIHTPL